jgi:hypothetical protein
MPMCSVVQFPGLTTDEWEVRIRKEIAPGQLPKGVASQVVGTSAEGVTVITVWDTEEGEQFFNDRVKPVLDKSGINPKVSKLKIHKHYQRE